ncbi:ParA family protein [Thermocaproicibacter melissae]|uniref:ParA family protein n=1 Tax=Thermocaproicibacter melissae TaxID=2966552 RepID=UPI0024B1E10A|nr:ParA family protein [Thermocaproicibacter melissae]WBY64720.1 ParA family protein [Thermocaproicibacter melissae]
MSNIIAVSLEKGGVGKTTTVLNIGAGFTKLGYHVLLVDLDQQGHLSRWLGWQEDGKPAISELIYQEVSKIKTAEYQQFVRHSERENLDYIPANKMLGGIYAILGADGESNTVLRRIFHQEFFGAYDYIIFDCPTAVDNLLVSNALQCSDKLLIPVQAEKFAYDGIPLMLQRYMAIKQTNDIRPFLAGMLITMYNSRTTMSKEVREALIESYGELVFPEPIPMLQEARNSTNDESPLCGSLVGRKNSRVGQAYLAAAMRIAGEAK